MLRQRFKSDPIREWYNNRVTTTKSYSNWTTVATFPIFSTGTTLLSFTTFGDEVFFANKDYMKVGSASIETNVTGTWTAFAAHPRLQAAITRLLLNDSVTASTPVEFLVADEQSSMTDVVTKNYRALQNEGRIINNPMSAEMSAFQYTPVPRASKTGAFSFAGGTSGLNYVVQVRYGPIKENTSFYPSRLDVSGLLGSLVSEFPPRTDSAVADAYAKLQDAELNLAMMAAEGRETYGFINDKLLALARILQKCKDPKTLKLVAKRTYARYKARIDKVGWTAKQLSEAYLEVRYALRPLMYDIQDLVAYFTGSPAQSRQNRYTFRRKLDSTSSGTRVYGTAATGIFEVAFTVNTTARAGVIAEKHLDVPGAQFGFTNLASIAWEKVKFSFILDWIINISGTLYMLNPNVSLRPLAAWVTSITDVSLSGTYTVPGLTPTLAVPFSAQRRVKTRNPVSRPPFAVIDINLDPLKILDLIAITGNLKGGKAPF